MQAFLLASAWVIFSLASPVRAQQEIMTLATRPDLTVKVLVAAPAGSAKGTLLMFPGGNGANHFFERAGKIRLSNNFLVRSSNQFVERGVVVAIVDVPSDQAYGMSDEFRTGMEHTEDIKKVIDQLAKKLPRPIFLIGTSRGTLSAAHLAISLADRRLGGVVLTASIGASKGRGKSLFDLSLGEIALAALFVHHREDGCWASRFNDALQIQSRMTKSLKTHFIEVLGGDPPRSGPCEGLSHHGFLGKEGEVVAAIADWLQGKPVGEKIGP